MTLMKKSKHLHIQHTEGEYAVALSPSCSSEFIDRLKHKDKGFWGLEPDEIILQTVRQITSS